MSTPTSRPIATICVFLLTVICIAGAFGLSCFGPEPLTATQSKVFDMLNFGWMAGVAVLCGMRGTDRRQL